jgi:anthranilate/para-aminobenzoate synthase component I
MQAVALCSELEDVERGVYSGALGWLGGDGALELSVVIRTLIVQKDRFEFQVGGGIVADSTPTGEWSETMDKAMGILRTLGVERTALEAL